VSTDDLQELLGTAVTEEAIAFEEAGLQELERRLLAKDDYASPESREQALQQFYELAAQLRATHQKARNVRMGRLN